MRCGNFFHSIAFWRARIATFGTGLWPARLRYVAPSNSCHSWRQSIVGVVAVAMGAPSDPRTFYGSDTEGNGQEPNWAEKAKKAAGRKRNGGDHDISESRALVRIEA